MKMLITGATGYIGQRLLSLATARGHEVIAATRNPPAAGIAWVPFDLAQPGAATVPEGTEVIIHLAAATRLRDALAPDSEVLAARALIAAARHAGARFIFVSSQAARSDAPTPYGRTKWQIERETLEAGGWVIRPGQVYGGPEQGLFGTLVNAIRCSPFIPAFLPAPMVQPVHVDDLAEALLLCATPGRVAPSMRCIGATTPVRLSDFLSTIARMRLRQYRLQLPIPAVFVRLAATTAGRRTRAGQWLNRLTSLFDLPVMATRHDLEALSISLRPWVEGMARRSELRRRQLIHEGHALLRYVLKARPTYMLVSRYVRCIEQSRGGQPMCLPTFMLRTPGMLALLDEPRGAFGEEFAWRMHAATALAEASTQGARRFIGEGGAPGRLASILQIARAVMAELGARALLPAIRPMLAGWQRRSRKLS